MHSGAALNWLTWCHWTERLEHRANGISLLAEKQREMHVQVKRWPYRKPDKGSSESWLQSHTYTRPLQPNHVDSSYLSSPSSYFKKFEFTETQSIQFWKWKSRDILPALGNFVPKCWGVGSRLLDTLILTLVLSLHVNSKHFLTLVWYE